MKWRIQVFSDPAGRQDEEIPFDGKPAALKRHVEAMAEADKHAGRSRIYVLTPAAHERVKNAKMPELE